MKTEFQFPANGTTMRFKATIESEYIGAYGGPNFPHLRIPIKMSYIDTPSKTWAESNVHKVVWGLGVDLFLQAGDLIKPVFQSGIQEHPLNFNGVTVPVNAAYIESVSRNLGGGATSVGIPMRIVALVDPQMMADDLNFGPLMTSAIQQVFVPTAHWHQRLLPELGYPQTRLVPLVLNLPSSLSDKNSEASQLWTVMMKDLSSAVDLFRTWHFEPKDLVSRLRPIIENALQVWLTLWNLPRPASGKTDMTLQTLNDALRLPHLPKDVKPCNASNGVIPVSAPNKRLCLALTMLHDLVALSNVESHGQTQGTYTMADAESLLYMTTGILRSLPQLWEEYPSAPNQPTVMP